MTKRVVCPICGLRVTTLGIELRDHLLEKHTPAQLDIEEETLAADQDA